LLVVNAERVSANYAGDAGAAYFEWQRILGGVGVLFEPRKFESFCSADAVLLDFGCGDGSLLATLPAKRRIGVEPNDAARFIAAKRGIEMKSSLEEVGSEEADVIISNHALEHVLRPLDELLEMRRVLKPGGTIVMWLPIDDWRAQRNPSDLDENHHLYTWTPQLMYNLLAECGEWTERRCGVVALAWHPRFVPLHAVLPRRVFELLQRTFAVAKRRRQLAVVARKPPPVRA
jgi:SAM-dependent methyltransferase